MNRFLLGCLAFLLFSSAQIARADEVHVAVAANFMGTLKALSEEFTKKTGHAAVPVSGATGKLSAQITNGAPFEVFLSADDEAPRKLEESGLAVPASRFTYALGKLVLYSAKADYVDAEGLVLEKGEYQHLAIANPKLAPYGVAAMSALERLGVLETARPKIVQGENIAQTLEFIQSGNAELGFVALSQVLVALKAKPGSYWIVPEKFYAPIKQDAVLLKKGEKNPAARALTEFLKSAEARKLIAASGYGVPAAPATPKQPEAPNK